ncbi:flagellar biosynthesis protein FliR [Rickettsiales bacterium Ac37b]|nr:flagellar biosynthesis protein FliR [Rickettsiales bacterium Ac37b]
MPESITADYLFKIILVFCRVGANLMVLPGIGELYVMSRSRLLFAIILSIIIYPIVSVYLPKMPEDIISLFLILFIEILMGVFLGLIVRILFSALHVAGMLITTQSGLGMAIMFDYNQRDQGAVFGTFLSSLAIVMVFLTNMHHVFIEAIIDSYQLLPYQILIVDDMLNAIIKAVAESFEIGVKIASPYVIVSLLILIISSVLSRLMPAVQVFFLMTPVQMLLSFFIFILTLSTSILWYFDYLYAVMVEFTL